MLGICAVLQISLAVEGGFEGGAKPEHASASGSSKESRGEPEALFVWNDMKNQESSMYRYLMVQEAIGAEVVREVSWVRRLALC